LVHRRIQNHREHRDRRVVERTVKVLHMDDAEHRRARGRIYTHRDVVALRFPVSAAPYVLPTDRAIDMRAQRCCGGLGTQIARAA
jgi:hypothetical protein